MPVWVPWCYSLDRTSEVRRSLSRVVWWKLTVPVIIIGLRLRRRGRMVWLLYLRSGRKARNIQDSIRLWDTYTRSGFLFKFLQIESPVEQAWSKGTQPWIDFRYGEILLNYASRYRKDNLYFCWKNRLHKTLWCGPQKSGSQDDIALTQANVRKERFVELAFENKRRWDFVALENFPKEFENRVRKGTCTFPDLGQILRIMYLYVSIRWALNQRPLIIAGIIKIFRVRGLMVWYRILN